MSRDGIRQKRNPSPAALGRQQRGGQAGCAGDGGVHAQHGAAARQRRPVAGGRAEGETSTRSKCISDACCLSQLYLLAVQPL